MGLENKYCTGHQLANQNEVTNQNSCQTNANLWMIVLGLLTATYLETIGTVTFAQMMS